jgi:iron complex outermembrane receptor protein
MLQQHQFSQEFQAIGSIPQFDYVFGLYYFNEHASEKAATPSSNKWNATGTGYTINSEIVFPPITSANQGWDPSSWFVQRASRAKAESYSAFGSLTYTPEWLDALHLTAGGRYTQDKRDGVLFTVINQPTNFTFKFDNGRFDPMVTLANDATQDIHLYATYATGFRAGGANDRSQTFNAFGPEEVKSYEIGAKTDWFDNRVRLNVAGYIMDRKGTQTDFDNVDTNPLSPTFNLHTEETRNASGTSNIRGVEAELALRVTDELTLGASYAYTYVKIPPTPNPFLGNVLFPVVVVFTPPNAAAAFADYELPLGNGGMSARFHLDATYADATYSFQAEPTVKTDSSFIVNGRISLSDIPLGSFGQTLTLSLWSRNLFDETHIYRRSAANAAVLGDYANFNPPRTFGVQATVKF